MRPASITRYFHLAPYPPSSHPYPLKSPRAGFAEFRARHPLFSARSASPRLPAHPSFHPLLQQPFRFNNYAPRRSTSPRNYRILPHILTKFQFQLSLNATLMKICKDLLSNSSGSLNPGLRYRSKILKVSIDFFLKLFPLHRKHQFDWH